MAEISRFYGMVIQMFGNDHNPPHYHVVYNEYRAIVEILTGELFEGNLPVRQLKLIKLWNEIHKDELLENFKNLRAENKTFKKITPLN